MSERFSRRSFLAASAALAPAAVSGAALFEDMPATLPGTEPLTAQGDLAIEMVKGIEAYSLRRTAESVEERQRHWTNADYSSPEAYTRSVEPNRQRLRKITGVVDPRVSFESPELEATLNTPALVAEAPGYKIYAVRWPVFEGVGGEGLLLEPDAQAVASVVALPDADQTPEMLAGVATGIAAESQFARRLAESGCRVIVPVLIDRGDTWAGDETIGFTNLTHREVVHRLAYELGRTLIGYEVQKVLAAVDWFERRSPGKPVGVFGYGEGGLIALYSGAMDTRIGAAVVSGYFNKREGIWQEPLYRNVWSLLDQFGDAEIARLIAPRTLIVEACRAPEIPGPPAPDAVHRKTAGPGALTTPPVADVRAEVLRARPFFAKLNAMDRLALVESQAGTGEPGSDEALKRFLRALDGRAILKPSVRAPRDRRERFDPATRMHRQFRQLIDYGYKLAKRSEQTRREFWAKADASSPENWDRSVEPYRKYLLEEVNGNLPPATEPLRVRTRLIYDEPKWTGYEVWIPVYPEVFSYGILLLPKDLKQGERRPLVFCQHGINRRVQYVVDPKLKNVYNNFAAKLAERGFIAYAPQNPYVGEPEYPFRQMQRKANPVKTSIFSFITAQYQRTLEWLNAQPYVDPQRVGFYGLSYGGFTALRVPPILKQFAVSICSAAFNEWVTKTTNWDRKYSFLLIHEYDFFDFDQANTFNHSELASLISPRPFMVERGHKDGVAPDEWVAYEYAKVRRHYVNLGIPDRTGIEFFNGGHQINAQGTFEFLHKHLNWPKR